MFVSLRSEAQDVRVVYLVDEVYGGQYTSNVMITNMTADSLKSWEMTFLLDQDVVDIEHVSWEEKVPGSHKVNGKGWTRDIAPGEIVWFTITGIAYEGEDPELPRSCFFNRAGCTVEPHPEAQQRFAQQFEMVVSTWIEESDFTTYRGFIVVQNPTDFDFPALWDLQFSTPSQIMEMEGVIWERSGTNYQLYGNAHTDLVRAHDFVLIPFSGVHTGVPALPSNCRLNGGFCSFQPPDRLIETPGLDVEILMAEETSTSWEGFIRIDNPTQNALEGWVLRFSMENRITEAEGMIIEQSGDVYTIRPAFGRGRILQESSYVFAIRGTWAGSIKPPEGCTINSILCKLKFKIEQDVEDDEDGESDPDDDDDDSGSTGGDPTVSCASPGSSGSFLPNVDFRFLNVQTPTGIFIAFIDITNTGTGIIKGWALEFQLVEGMTVTSIRDNTGETPWSLIGDNFRITPTPENDCILPGDDVRLTIQGTHDGRWDDPQGCNFGGNICVWQRVASVGKEDEFDILPEDTALLHPAYPNPFNPVSRIEFDVQRAQSVRVELWDTLGRMRKLLYDGFAHSGESKSVQIDGTNLASGVYFVRLVPQNGQVRTQTVILQK